MKKLFFACSFAICIAAVAMSGNSASTSGKKIIGPGNCYSLDTVPHKKDSTKKPIPDSNRVIQNPDGNH